MKKRWGQAGGWDQCCDLTSVFWHCWLGDRELVCSTENLCQTLCLCQKFSFGTVGGGNPRGTEWSRFPWKITHTTEVGRICWYFAYKLYYCTDICCRWSHRSVVCVCVIGGTVCSVIPGAAGLGTGITDVSLLARSSWRQPAVAGEVPRRRSDRFSGVGQSCHTSSNSQPRQLHSVKCFHENCLEKCLQETEDDRKQLESVSTPATKGEFACQQCRPCC